MLSVSGKGGNAASSEIALTAMGKHRAHANKTAVEPWLESKARMCFNLIMGITV
jgi:hypothetical protein